MCATPSRRRDPARFCAILAIFVAGAMAGIARAESSPPAHYEPYAFLVGDWDVAPQGTPPGIVARFRWGPGQSYLWHSVAMLDERGEHPHFEGMFAWNGVSRSLDMLIVVDLAGGRVLERGTLSVQPDGSRRR